jgi:hypothetical protein
MCTATYQTKKAAVLDKITDFATLEEGWNGYGSLKISDEVIEIAKNLVLKLQRLPDVFPTGRNSIQLEYENFDSGNYLEIEVFPNKSVCYYENKERDEYDEFLVDNVQNINKLIARLNVA